MEINIMDITKMIKDMDMGYLFTKMVRNIQVIGKMIK
jgi:hypothetical protein